MSYPMSKFDFTSYDLSSPSAIRQVEELYGLPKNVLNLVILKSQSIVRDHAAAVAAVANATALFEAAPTMPNDVYADYVAAWARATQIRQQWTTRHDMSWGSASDVARVAPLAQHEYREAASVRQSLDERKRTILALDQARVARFHALIAFATSLRDATLRSSLAKLDPSTVQAFDAI